MYIIKEYDQRYRPVNKSGGELKGVPDYVKLPANPKGDGLQELLEHSRGLEVFGVWCLLLEKTTAQKEPENRGKLLNRRNEPATISEIAKGISLPKKVKFIKYALSVLVAMGWVQMDGEAEQTSANFRNRGLSLKEVKGKEKGSKDAEQSSAKPSPAEFLKYWKEKKLPAIRSFTKERKRKFEIRLREPLFAENWKQIIDKVAASAFCTGNNDRGWRVKINWILENETNYTKVLEGDYDNQGISEEERKQNKLKAEQRKREEIHKDYGQYVQEQTTEDLEKLLKAGTAADIEFLIREVLTERSS